MSTPTRVDPNRVASVFDAVADLTPTAVDRRLEAECAGDDELRKAVVDLLSHDRAADSGFLVPPPFEGLGQPGAATNAGAHQGDALSTRTVMPSRLGRYYLLHKLGEGGMGAVFAGYDEQLGRRVALKILRRSALGHAWLLREGQALGRLSHPNVLAVHEVGEQDGRPFLAMEFVEGTTLRAWMDESPRPFSDVLRMFMQAGRGVSAIHRAGLVHRDIKPDNVLIGKDGRARVADLGIASLVGREQAPEADGADAAPGEASILGASLTQPGALVGTPSFMAPEQFSGAGATPASDQWSFAVALYRAAFGSSPFPATDHAALVKQLREQLPAVPSRRPEVPAWLWPILQRALDRDPARRFESMDTLLAAIAKHLPRDPDLDPTLVVRERERLGVLFVTGYLLNSVPLMFQTTAGILLRPQVLVWFQAVTFAIMSVLVAVRWQALSRNKYGRRLASIFLTGTLLLLSHRIVGARLGQSGAVIVVGDAFVLASLYLGVAHFSAPWLGWLAAIAGLSAVAGAFDIDHAPVIIGLGGVATVVAMLVRTYVDSSMNAESAISGTAGDLEDTETHSDGAR